MLSISSRGAFAAETHTCPVCGHTGPCTRSAGETGQYRYHNCHVCGSTWKEQRTQGEPGDKDSKATLQTA
ncbi:formate dehydrogenase accessory protein FdhE [Candidatus Bathyarchaeota archaeon]|nr:MAG: formate dehydrogenase accessory protein FdhE [Candidatus Bathyarchaeota archaeon]TMI50610.1 MAG: formate dehydrogenase accessory protein FdhE [Candidatus Bathyarchaeota archaeon]TMI55170.1 MAG: formate dehydrogenase accessory protein FdhE [Candidatus Bathyarchaeota archaeon]